VNTVEEVKLQAGDKGFIPAQFMELEKARMSPTQRAFYEGHVVRLTGKLRGNAQSNKRFTLFRDKINCCVPDAIRLNLVVESPNDLDIKSLQGQWVEATGRLAFAQQRGKDEYVAVIVMRDQDDFKQVPEPPDPYIY
jgi:uncharacterized membrane protein YcgQ (UPF0703/DUF1980 family)